VKLTVGRHAAGDGAGVDPIVAAALRQRPTSVEPGTARHGQEFRQRELTGADSGGLGWPGEPHSGTGLGWPVDLLPETAATGEQPAVALLDGERPARRRGWRRFFGSSAA
jgi:hypothetical protein